VTRSVPPRDWLLPVLALEALNFAVFWILLFMAAYRLPGGVAATLGAVQAILVIGLARGVLGTPVRLGAVTAAVAGVFGVALLLLGPDARLDPVGVAARVGGAAPATYGLWLRGIARLEPGAVSMLGMMSPVTAVILGWVWLGQSLSPLQALGAAVVLGSVWAGQRANRIPADAVVGRDLGSARAA
jgi:probable blue pigment (indigoidine) exporter